MAAIRWVGPAFAALVAASVFLATAGAESPDSAAGAPGYLWPVKATPVVTGVFCDARNGHPHGGLDISLFGKVGTIPIVSVDEGVLMRLRTSRYGYGNAVYVRMPGKKVAVYAHLDRFSPRLERVAAELREKTGQYDLDYYYEPWEMTVPIARGETIGMGGKSGTSTAHLHFEIRDDDVVNLNPLTSGFAVKDDVAPNIGGLLLSPIDAASAIDGGRSPRRLRGAGGEHVRLRGRVGLSVDAADRHAAKGRRFSPYRIEVRVDGAPYFETRFDQWGYIDQRIEMSQYDRDAKGARYLRAYNPWPVEVPFYSKPDAGTFDDLAPGDHEVEIIVADPAGNADRAVLRVTVEGAGSASRPWPYGASMYRLFNGARAATPDGSFEIAGGEKSFFAPLLIDINDAGFAHPAAETACVSVPNPGGPARRQAFGVSFAYGEDAESIEQLAVYAIDGGKAGFLGADRPPVGRRVSGQAFDFGTYCLLRDAAPPAVDGIRAARAPAVAKFVATDDIAGLANDGVRAQIDGKPALVRYSASTGRGEVFAIGARPRGERTISIAATDRVGNVTNRQAVLVIK
ncbi:M23 family metallopeptidase [bacterium]|nr:M23 family metallopeptidase [bacterium]